ncbi:MAG: hypothetical protein PHY26_01080 [Bacilli bacterium]|jgi:hypothetical protein|nr:hypothetical protein [Bacilli bacterium]
MKRNQKKSKQYIILVFIAVITYLVVCLFSSFRYVDLGYLVVIVVTFIRFLRIKDFG